METIGLIAAMALESGALLRYIKGWKRTRFGQFRGYRFQMMNRDCLLVTSGMGLTRATNATRALLAESGLHLLVSFGIAGAVNADLNIGDVVISGNTCLLDKGLLGQPKPLAPLSEAARNAAKEVLLADGARLLQGTAITTLGALVVGQQLWKMPNPVLEMETAGIAQAAAEKGIPFVSIRAISDGPQAPIPIDLEAVMDDEHNFRIGRMLKMFLRRPQIIFQSRQMMQNSRKAANHAAEALVAVLSQLSPIMSS